MKDLSPSPKISDSLSDAQRRLVETGSRNRLIHVNRTSKRAKVIDLVDHSSSEVFEALRVRGQRLGFRSFDPEGSSSPNLRKMARRKNGKLTSLQVRSELELLERRIMTLHKDARTAEEEQGVNILYLAIGFLRWYESDSSQVLRESPLILMPVELSRNERGATFELRPRDTEIVTNTPLQERLRADFGFELPEIDDDETFIPDTYFDELESRIQIRSRWSVDRDGMQLGFFSFSKLLMMRDLDSDVWPEGALDGNGTLTGLLGEGFSAEPSLFGGRERLDARLSPSDLLHVVPADASQTRVIEEVRSGRNLVVQGPPGTGKSQTIANIIAGAAYDGKTVLFVAEKMAALTVVHDRLKKVGLGDLCLEIHSRAANKRDLLVELSRTLRSGEGETHATDQTEELISTRDHLNRVTSLLHDPVPGHDFTPFQAMSDISRFVGRGVPAPRIPIDGLSDLAKPDLEGVVEQVRTYANLSLRAGPTSDHPFFGVGETGLQPTDLRRVGEDLVRALRSLGELKKVTNEAAVAAGVPVPTTLRSCAQLETLLEIAGKRPKNGRDQTGLLLSNLKGSRIIDALEAGRLWADHEERGARVFNGLARESSAELIRSRISMGVSSFWSRLFGPYRTASKELGNLLVGRLPAAPNERLKLANQLVELQRAAIALSEEEAFLRDALGTTWRGSRTPFRTLHEQAIWLSRVISLCTLNAPDQVDRVCAAADHLDPVRASTGEVFSALEEIDARLYLDWPEGEKAPLDLVGRRLVRIRDGLDRYAEWSALSRQASELTKKGIEPLVALIDKGRVRPESAEDELRYAVAEARWVAARRALPALDELTYLDRHALVHQFRNLEERRLSETRDMIRSKHLAQLPKGASGQMGFLRGEMAKKRNHKPIRKIMQAAGPMVQRIKPVFLMSPISIAQYLPPESAKFDLLIIDEASQVRPEEALGAIARCRQIVVVGDQKQLPPTSFFDRMSGSDETDEDETDEIRTALATEMESVLTLCDARGLKSAMLEWHYRSRDPSLIAVNNAEFYESRLILPPSPLQNEPEYGLSFRRVPGSYSSRSRGGGRPGTNRIEAEEIAKEVALHARSRPDLSLGVIAFSKTQSDMLTEALEKARRDDEILDAFLREGRAEDMFVKNIENVQGDERDVILISVGYGPEEPNGRLASMSFGPVNLEGGERRLNVLFSRARARCVVFCSFDPGDIDLTRVTKEGPRVLKRFLDFARSGQMAQPEMTGELADSPFEEDVADVIRNLGFPCDYQVGSGGFRIDIGVRNPDQPGRYILAVECDGATYHSALWARERDRLRQDVLEGLGWRFHRIWSTDWFHRRQAEVDRLRAALSAARVEEGPIVEGANAPDRASQADDPPVDDEQVETPPPPAGLKAPIYAQHEPSFPLHGDPHEAPVASLIELIENIVIVEGPLHEELIARRIAGAYGKAQVGSRIRATSDAAISHAARTGRVLMRDGFVMTRDQMNTPPVRDRSGLKPALKRPELLPPLEVRAAAARVISESGEMPREELIVATARLLGFARVGADLRGAIDVALDLKD